MNKTDIDNSTFTTKTIGGKKYIIKSVYVGNKDVKKSILNLAEKRAIREMGLMIPLDKNC